MTATKTDPVTKGELEDALLGMARLLAPGNLCLTAKEVATFLNRSPTYIWRMKKEGIFLSGDRYPKTDVLAWQRAINRHQIRLVGNRGLAGEVDEMRRWLKDFEEGGASAVVGEAPE